MITYHFTEELQKLQAYVSQTKYLIVHEHFNYETNNLVDGGLFVTLSLINFNDKSAVWGFSEEEAAEYNSDVIEELLTENSLGLFS